MGLDATVMCNCFKTKTTSPPPFPREWIEIADDAIQQTQLRYTSIIK
jgi:hypothetical protein